ncbi:hypothetical protein ACFX19_043940 [Malus domestica]
MCLTACTTDLIHLSSSLSPSAAPQVTISSIKTLTLLRNSLAASQSSSSLSLRLHSVDVAAISSGPNHPVERPS